MNNVTVILASIGPKYNATDGGSGYVEVRTQYGQVIMLHVDGSDVETVIYEQVMALCEVAGMDHHDSVAQADKAANLGLQSLAANRRSPHCRTD